MEISAVVEILTGHLCALIFFIAIYHEVRIYGLHFKDSFMRMKYLYYYKAGYVMYDFFYNLQGKCNILSIFAGGCKNRALKLLILKSKKKEDPKGYAVSTWL